MKKFLFMFIAFMAMTVAANATDYTGKVSEVQMGSKTPTVDDEVTFSVDDDFLTGSIDIDSMSPAHHIELEATINGTSFPASGTATVHGVSLPYSGTITVTQLDSNTLIFTFKGNVTLIGTTVAFTFTGYAE